MTFVSEDVRTLFHQLPTATQVEFTEWEAAIAKRGRTIRIEQVILGRPLEVVMRFTEYTRPDRRY